LTRQNNGTGGEKNFEDKTKSIGGAQISRAKKFEGGEKNLKKTKTKSTKKTIGGTKNQEQNQKKCKQNKTLCLLI